MRKLSIITVTWNNLDGLRRTLSSCRAILADGTVELIVIDGASTDGTLEFLREWIDSVRDRVIVRSDRDDGIYDAMNKGVELASGAHVVFMNAGDEFPDSFFPPPLDSRYVYYGNAVFFSPSDRYEKRYSIESVRDFLSHNVFCHQSIYYPLWLIKELGGYNKNYSVSADFDLTLRAFLRTRFISLESLAANCQLGGFSHEKGWLSYIDRAQSLRTNCGFLWFLPVALFAPIFFIKHRIVKTLDGGALLRVYRKVKYRSKR